VFGFRLEDYDALFDRKSSNWLLKIRQNPEVNWSGNSGPP